MCELKLKGVGLFGAFLFELNLKGAGFIGLIANLSSAADSKSKRQALNHHTNPKCRKP